MRSKYFLLILFFFLTFSHNKLKNFKVQTLNCWQVELLDQGLPDHD